MAEFGGNFGPGVIWSQPLANGTMVGEVGPVLPATQTVAPSSTTEAQMPLASTSAASRWTTARSTVKPWSKMATVTTAMTKEITTNTSDANVSNATLANSSANSSLNNSNASLYDWDGDKKSYHEMLEEEAVNESYNEFEEMAHTVAMLFAAMFMLACIVGNLMHICHISFIPESLVVIIIGMLLGLIEVEVPDVVISMQEETLYNKLVLSLFLLPIIIFEAGWSMRHKDFVAQLGYILVFAIFGTVICMVVVAFLTLWTCQWHGICSARTAFAYGALISAVDPVATLATYAHLNVDPLLNIMVLGESIINDAVAIVLFSVLNDKPNAFFADHTTAEIAGDITLGVLRLLGGSVGLGIGLGALYVVLIRVTKLSHSPSLAILFIFTSAFFSYTFAEEVLKLSGIITVLFAGMIMSSYSTPHLTVEGRLLTSFLLKQMGSLADMAVFLFVGIAVVYASVRGLIAGCFIMVFCLVGRGIATVPLAVLCNLCKARKATPPEKQTKLTWRHIFMMWHAGLRGGIALVLALDLGKWVDELDGPGTREALRNATLLVIVVFLLIFGGTTEAALKCMKIQMGNPSPMPIRDSRFRRILMSGSRHFLKPILVGNREVQDHLDGGIVRKILEESEERRAGAEAAGAESDDEKQSFQHQETAAAYDLFGEVDPQRQRSWMDTSEQHHDGADLEEDYRDDGSEEELGSYMSTPLY